MVRWKCHKQSKEVTALVCPALLCAFSYCSVAFFPLILLSFLVPFGRYHCLAKYHTKLSCSSTRHFSTSMWQWHYMAGGCHQASSLVTSSSGPPFSHMVTLAYHWFSNMVFVKTHISNCKPLLPWLHLLGHLSQHICTLASRLKHDKTLHVQCKVTCCLGSGLGLGNWHHILTSRKP